MTFPGSVTYLKLVKLKGFGELCAATSDLANQTGIEKKDRSFDHPQAELDILSFQKKKKKKIYIYMYIYIYIYIYIYMGHGNQRPKIKLDRAFVPVLVTSNFNDDSIIHE